MDSSSKRYICPRCQTTLQIDNTHQVELYLCPKDHGAWIEEEQVPLTFSRQITPKNTPGRATHINHRYSPACPDTKMDIYYFNEIEIDVCMITGGIWLDKDEILPIAIKIAHEEERSNQLHKQGSTLNTWDWIDLVLNALSWFLR
ncbi:MAG: hypothetical protein COA73_17665 [Candidatus Hydrogenedentota bacterium]|nr:MAG: hypothetical protein COA73_17665 [Candidatus Hydrogenedentota bacterium]